MRSAVWQVVNLAGSKALSSVVLLLVTASIARLLGPAQLGRWTLMLAAGAMLHTLFVNWTHAATVRFGREEWARSRSLRQTLGSRLPILAVSVALGAALLAWPPFDWGQQWFGIAAGDRWLVGLFAASLWITAEAQATAQAIDRLAWQTAAAPVIAVVTALAASGLAFAESPSLVLAALVVTAPAIAGWGLVWAAGLRVGMTGGTVRPPTQLGQQLVYGLPLIPTFALGYLSDWGDHLLLTRLTSATEVGVFALSYQFLASIMAANGVMTTVLLPRLIAANVERPGALQDYLANEVPTICALWMLPMVWVLAVLPVAVAMLAGPAFAASPLVLLALLVSTPASVLSSLYTVLFNVEVRMGRVLLYMLIMTTANVVASVMLIPRLGALGAAAGTALSYLLGQALFIQDQHRLLGVSPRRIWTLWLAGLFVGLSQFLAGSEIVVRLVWALAATASVIGAVRLGRCADTGVIRRLLAAQPGLRHLVARVLVPGGARR